MDKVDAARASFDLHEMVTLGDELDRGNNLGCPLNNGEVWRIPTEPRRPRGGRF